MSEYPQQFQPASEQPTQYQPVRRAPDSIPVAVWGLIVVNVTIFALTSLTGGPDGTASSGVLYAPAIWQGQWWRLLTAMFLHANFLHVAVNMWALHALGRDLETIYGTPRFLVMYFGAGWAGSLASLMFSGNSVGASGAIFGLAGAWLAIALYRRRYFQTFGAQVLSVVLINLAIGFSVPMIDNNGHIGGLLGGLLLGVLVPNRLPEFQARWRWPATVAAFVVLLAATLPAITFSRQNLGVPTNATALNLRSINPWSNAWR